MLTFLDHCNFLASLQTTLHPFILPLTFFNTFLFLAAFPCYLFIYFFICFPSPSAEDRKLSSSQADALSSPAAASAYITELAWVFQMLVFAPGIPHLSLLSCSSLCHIFRPQLFPSAVCFSFCIFFNFSVIWFYSCLSLFSSTTSLCPLTICCPCSFSFPLIYLLSCAFPRHTPLFLPRLFLSTVFTPPWLMCSAHTSFSMSRWESQNASERERKREREARVACHLYIVFTLPLVKMCTRNVWREENMWWYLSHAEPSNLR